MSTSAIFVWFGEVLKQFQSQWQRNSINGIDILLNHLNFKNLRL